MDDQAREQSKCRLAVEVLQSWGELRLRAEGLSMLPTLWPGDLLTIQAQTSEQVEAGDLVLYAREGRFFVHRVVSKSSRGGQVFVMARGDCMSQEDPPVCEAELLGTVTEIRRRGSVLAPTAKLPPFHMLFACVLCHWSFFRRVALHWHARGADTDAQFKVGEGEAAL